MLVPAPSYRWQWWTTTVQHLSFTKQRSASRVRCCCWHFPGALLKFSAVLWQHCQWLQIHVFSQTVENTEPSYDSALRLISWRCCEYTFGFSGLGQEQHTRSLIAKAHFSEQTVCFQLLLFCAVISCKWVLRVSVCKHVV